MNLLDIFENDDDMFAPASAPGKYYNNTPQLYKDLFNQLVPAGGHAPTVEGELLRAASKLGHEYYNNGMGNNVSGAENYLRTFCGGSRMFRALDVLHPYTRGIMFNGNKQEEQQMEIALDQIMDLVIQKIVSANGNYHPNNEDMYDYSNSDDEQPEYDYDEDDEDEDDVYEAEVELDEPPAPERKQQTKTKPKFDYDPFQQQQKDQPLAQQHTSKGSEKPTAGPKMRKASAASTRRAMGNVNIPTQGMDYLSNLNIDIDPDLAPYPDEEPVLDISTEVNTENLPAVAGEALQAAGTTSPEFHQVARLPGNMSRMIRQLGKALFGSMTNTPTEEIYMIGNLGGQGPNTRQEVNAVANFVREQGKDMGPGDIDFDQVMPGYKAQTHQYEAAGVRWLLVKDFAGEYIYAWPEADSKTPGSQAQLRESEEDMFAHSEKPKHLVAASKWRRGGEMTGTSLVGYVVTTYDKIVNTFGEPYYTSDDPTDKVPAEWVITFKDGKVATIYVYKTGGVVPKEEYRWHVGGNSRDVLGRVSALLGPNDTLPLGEGLTPAGEFLDKVGRVKKGDKIYYKGKLAGIATGEVDGDKIFFVPNPELYGKHMTGVASLPSGVIVLR